MNFLIALTLPAVPSVVMVTEWGDESKPRGVAANAGGSMATLRTMRCRTSENLKSGDLC